MKSVAIFVLFFGTMQLGHAGERLDLHAGKKTAGGAIQLPFEYTKNNILRLGVDISPELGYFIADKWLLSFGPTLSNLTVHSSDPTLTPGNAYRWGAQLKIRYFFDTDSSFYPFIGFGAGLSLNNWTVITMRWVFELPLGVTWAVSENIGLQFATPLSFEGGPLGFFERLRFTPGYVGVIALF